MQLDIRMAAWNSNGLSNHILEVETFLINNHIDIFFISETHFTNRTFFKIRGYDLITTNHPDDSAHGGSAILIKSNFNYETFDHVKDPMLQSSIIKLKLDSGDITVGSVYFPPRYNVQCNYFDSYFALLGPKFIVAGDFNAKHPWWGSRLINPKGRELIKSLNKNGYSVLSTGQPTYWPSDPSKIPDVLDFAVYHGICSNQLEIASLDDLSSDHTPIIINLCAIPSFITKNSQIITNKTDIESFKYWMDKNLDLNVEISDGNELNEAVEMFTRLTHEAAFLSTPQIIANQNVTSRMRLSREVRDLLRSKRRLRRIWQLSRNPIDKENLNRAARHLKHRLLEVKNDFFSQYLNGLHPNGKNEHKLWNATKYLKKPTKRNSPIKNLNDVWCRSNSSKSEAFSEYLEKVFQPFPANCDIERENEIKQFLDAPCQMDFPIKLIDIDEVFCEISELNSKKSPGYDKIDSKVTKLLSKKSVSFLTLIFNSILKLCQFPSQWKCSEVIMVQKPNKPETLLTSYRPISLLTTFSKIFEKLFLRRLKEFLDEHNIIPDYQFGFRSSHGTPEQCHRIINEITNTLENKSYCSAVFLDIQQAFDKVWHTGLLFKLKSLLPTPYYLVVKSYLENRSFYVNVKDEMSEIRHILAGVPQGSVLAPTLYTIYTSDMPQTEEVTIATYADDTALLACHQLPTHASALVQNALNRLEKWLNTWRMRVNNDKSTHVVFTLKRGDCPSLMLNRSIIPKSNCVKYLGLHLDKRLTWKNHIKMKRLQLNIKTKKLNWLLGPRSQLKLENKLLLYKSIIKPIWTYGIQLWGTSSTSNLEILQRFQSKTLRYIVNAPWYVTNRVIHKDLKIAYIKDEVKNYSQKYLQRISNHANVLAIQLLDDTDEIYRLKRFHILDLPFRN